MLCRLVAANLRVTIDTAKMVYIGKNTKCERTKQDMDYQNRTR